MLDCTASIVAFNSPPEMLRKAAQSFLSCSLKVELIVVDNSQTQVLKESLDDLPINYLFSGYNAGYGKGHNRALEECSKSKYHIIINPDILFDSSSVEIFVQFMDENPTIGMACPKVLNVDGTLQHLNKRYPNVFVLFIRRFIPRLLTPLFIKSVDRYEMKDKGYDSTYDVEAMSGSFMFCRTEVLRKVGGFDPRYFMYFEDFDLSRKVQEIGYRTVYYPQAQITHLWERAAHKNLWMTFVFGVSMFRYFNKWGWRFY